MRVREVKSVARRIARACLLPMSRWHDTIRLSDRSSGKSKRWAVRSTDPTGEHPQFFVLGSPRSGTTLLRAMLCAHPALYIPPENGSLHDMIRTFAASRTAEWTTVVDAVLERFREGYEFEHWRIDLQEIKEAARLLAPKERTLAALIGLVYRHYGLRHAPGKKIWGDKSTPGSFRFLHNVDLVFPDARYVHIVRDARDCVASCLRAGFFNHSHYIAAHAWRYNVSTCRKFGRRPGISARFLEIRYEDLVCNPEEVTGRICELLSIEKTDAMLRHHVGVQSSAPDVAAISHHKNVLRPINQDSVGKGQASLQAPERRLVTRITAPELRHYGYSLANNQCSELDENAGILEIDNDTGSQ